MRSHSILASGLALLGSVSATRLFVGSSVGNLTTLELPAGLAAEECGASAQVQTLKKLHVSDACGPYATWFTQVDDILYCLDENWADAFQGSLHSLRVGADGSVTPLDSQKTIGSPVSSIIYGNGKGLAVAGYSGGGISTFDISNPSALKLLQNETYPLRPGGNATAPQTQSRAHHTIVDPTGKFLLVPDLGSDYVRVFSIDDSTLKVTPVAPLEMPRGTGPRHGTFVKTASKTFFYVVTELSNGIYGYEVTYGTNALSFTQVHASNTHGKDVADTMPGVAAAEISVTPDNNFVMVSSRNEKSLTIPNIDPTNSTQMISDPLITFTVDKATGKLAHLQTRAAGGISPRHFSFNANGTLVAVSLFADGVVTLIERDPSSGLLYNIVGAAKVPTNTNAAIFDETIGA